MPLETELRSRNGARSAWTGIAESVLRSAGRAGCTARAAARPAAPALRSLIRRLLPPAGTGGLERPVSDYKAPQFWLHYGSGFLRRALPGALLRRLAGGPPSYRQVEAASVGLARISALAVVPLAVQAAHRAAGPLPRAAMTAVLLLSPLTCSLLLHDVGRYDGVGVLVLAGSVLARKAWPRLPLPVTAAVLGGGVLLAVASEEFLLAVLGPTVLTLVGLVARGRELDRRGTALLLAAVLGPGTVAAGASLARPAPEAVLSAARAEAMRAGAAPPGAMGDALSALGRGFVENLAFARLFEPRALVGSFALWSGLFGATAALMGRLLTPGGAYPAAVWAHAAVGTVLSGAGVDFRRWWGLALVGLLSTVMLLDDAGTDAAPSGAEMADAAPSGTVVAAAAALALAGIAARDVRVHPWGPLRVDQAPA